jgi:hypothetical protein
MSSSAREDVNKATYHVVFEFSNSFEIFLGYFSAAIRRTKHCFLDGFKRCAQRIDVGEHLYSVPLIDDVSGDGYLDLIVSTMNGHVMVLESSVPYHPLNAW